MYIHAHVMKEHGGGYVVEHKMELMFVKLGATYYGMWQSETSGWWCVVECKMELTFVKLGAAHYSMWKSMLINILNILKNRAV